MKSYIIHTYVVTYTLAPIAHQLLDKDIQTKLRQDFRVYINICDILYYLVCIFKHLDQMNQQLL